MRSLILANVPRTITRDFHAARRKIKISLLTPSDIGGPAGLSGDVARGEIWSVVTESPAPRALADPQSFTLVAGSAIRSKYGGHLM
jgi:hypothetical protein